MINRLCILEKDLSHRDAAALRNALLFMELDYTFLMHGTKRNVVDVMIPAHHERISFVKWSVQRRSSNVSPELKEGLTVDESPEDSPENRLEQMVLTFKQTVDAKQLSLMNDHAKIAETLQELMEILRVFRHLIKHDSGSGFQGTLLFGPQGSGKTLSAQTLAVRQEIAFFNIPVDQLISKWVDDTEK